jgi:predicted HAD superfamily Cof-like phosphohydrolase
MTKHQKNIREFTRLAGQDVPDKPMMQNVAVNQLRIRLISEEFEELIQTINAGDLVGIYDAILDLDYVVTGAACAFGMDMEPGQAEVHRSNMSKFKDGYQREDGKWIKGPSYSPAKLKEILEDQSK